MKIYQVTESDWNWYDIKGTFVSRSAAEAQMRVLQAIHKDLHSEYWDWVALEQDDNTPRFGTSEYEEWLGAHPRPDVGEHIRSFFYSIEEHEVQ